MVDASLMSLFVRPLNQLRIPYMVTGDVASVVYGEPRFTRDIDLVIALRPSDARRFADAWPAGEFASSATTRWGSRSVICATFTRC